MLPSRDSPQTSQASSRAPQPPSPPAQQSEEPALVESPTYIGSVSPEIPSISRTLPPSSTTPSFSATLQVPDNSDAVSIRSVGSTASKKRRPWRRGSNPSAPVPARSATLSSSPSSSRRGTGASGGLASALAASGLAMANPGMTIPPISPAPAETTATSARGRSSVDGPRSRGASITYPTSDYSDRDSFHSGQDESLISSDESDDLDLDPDDIPVTGFAVASNKRNQDFHELFPSVPEGDYLIEDYGCALQREILIQGRLYISENHVCFHANIFGWITDLSIPMYEVIALEKRMTAFVIPNAIQLSTRTAKYTFTSFLSRDTTFDVLFNVWRLARPEESIMGSQILSARGSLEEGSVADGGPNGAGAKKIQAKSKVTQCDCGKNGLHYPEVAMEAVFPGTPEMIYNLMFTSGFMKDFMRENQKLLDIQISDWTPTEEPRLLSRNMTYIKPLNGSIGPKQTRCELRDETITLDFDNYVSMLTTTRTPEVPSGSVFSVKTRTCITWASSLSSKVLVTTQVEWTGRSFIKGIIEKSCLDGQKTYHVDLEKAMRDYIHANRAEFVPDGVDVAAVEEAEAAAAPPETPVTPHRAQSEEEMRKAREHERDRRGLQWAYDTFEGAFKVAQQSTEGALELIRDAWTESSSTTILYFAIVFLVISNVWTLAIMGNREEVGRRKEMQKMEEREKWVQGIVTGLWEEMLATRGALGGGAVPPMPPRAAGGDLREEVGAIVAQLDIIEQRIADIRGSLNQLD
ncbi:hypothetical protein K466DRAFT_574562 [Polyporus arcularius HHB13444]|uniref:VASt domain-containing protein n=1 Tax=Polyporus arcularius HHB13444 TaxID=1314778 RepID=A0A5C3PJ67_9APHY|nr:hypothetical protein K466DRAFT_574562 [Polyporus arcularius HHB13444]